jgi:hypothetical protein
MINNETKMIIKNKEIPIKNIPRKQKECLDLHFKTLNLFKDYVIDERQLRIQKWSTRLLAIIILLIYAMIQVQSKQIQIGNPPLTTYIDLYDKHKDVKCPCTKISILYKEFVTC